MCTSGIEDTLLIKLTALSAPLLIIMCLFHDQARNIRNRPVVNKDSQVSRLLEMREEIAALRDELYRTQVSKPTTANTVTTADSSVMVEVSMCMSPLQQSAWLAGLIPQVVVK